MSQAHQFLFDKKWECPFHKGNNRCLLHLNSNTNVHRMCLECKSSRKINDSDVLSIPDLLQSDERTFFSTFPILEDNQSLLNLRKLES